MRRFLIISLLCGLGLIDAMPAAADEVQIQESAPDRYIVVKGDTLWDISGRFLKQPWRWPEIWRLNQEQIKDPHWIYPGDVIVLDRTQQPPRLSVEGHEAAAQSSAADSGADANASLGSDGSGREHLAPSVQSSQHSSAISSIPQGDIQAFMGHPLVVDAGTLALAPRVIAFDGRRTLGSAGDLMFATGSLAPGTKIYQVYRPGPPLVDPVSHQTLAYRADYVGNAQLSEAGETSRFTLLKGAMEVNIGDRLLEADPALPVNFVPRAPDQQLQGHVLAVDSGSNMAARHSVVIVSLGSADGLQPGHVLAVYPAAEEVEIAAGKPVKLPETRSGLLFVFRTFERVSYALVVQSLRPVNVLDYIRNP
jgi:hypothetical protein